MQFTYDAYRGLLALLQQKGYGLSNYHNWESVSHSVVLRHDIDYSIDSAVRLGQLEYDLGVQSTYFVLLRTDFYNPASQHSLNMLRSLQSMGHEIGLHFDEKAYPEGTQEETVKRILKERDILERILETPVTTVSMHRPSKATLEADLQIPGMVNSYGKTFFHDFKYLSDSRRHWREPVLEIIRSGEYERLHILTHAFWYGKQEETIAAQLSNFIHAANNERYIQMNENFTDLNSVLHSGPKQD